MARVRHETIRKGKQAGHAREMWCGSVRVVACFDAWQNPRDKPPGQHSVPLPPHEARRRCVTGEGQGEGCNYHNERH